MTKKQESFWRMTLLGVSVGLFLGGIYLMGNRGSTPAAKKLYEDVMSIDLDVDYPKTPDGVIKINNNISLYFYGGAALARSVPDMVGQQRKLLSMSLLQANPKDKQIEKMKDEVKKYARLSQTMTETEILEIIYTGDKKDRCNVTVAQYIGKNKSQKLFYEMIIEGERWKINAWYPLS